MNACPDCRGYGRVSNGRDPMDPGYDDGPCPNPACAEGEAERAGALRVREANCTGPRLHPIFEQALAPFAPLEKAA